MTMSNHTVFIFTQAEVEAMERLTERTKDFSDKMKAVDIDLQILRILFGDKENENGDNI